MIARFRFVGIPVSEESENNFQFSVPYRIAFGEEETAAKDWLAPEPSRGGLTDLCRKRRASLQMI